MDNEKMLIEMGYAIRKRITSREEFLRTMSYIIPWAEWVDYVRPLWPVSQGDDRQTVLLLRMYLLQKWFGIEDMLLEDTIYDSYAMWLFLGINTLGEEMPGQEIYDAFREALESDETADTLLEATDNFLRRYGRKMVKGRVVEAAIVQESEDMPFTPEGTVEYKAQKPTAVYEATDEQTWTPVSPEPLKKEAETPEAVRQLEERLNRLEQAGTTATERHEEIPSRSGRKWGLRIILTLVILAVLTAGAVAVYDYLQTGIWFRWFRTDAVQVLDNTPPPTGTPAETPIPTQQGVMVRLTPAPLVTTIAETDPPEEQTPAPQETEMPTSTPESLFAQISNTQTPTPDPTQTPEPTETPMRQSEISTSLPYDADAEIRANLARMDAGEAPATVITSEAAPQRKISITIDGLRDSDTMNEILNILSQHNMPVTFYPTGMQATEEPDIIRAISAAGHPVENYTLRGETQIQTQDARALVENFTKTNKIIETITGITPTRLKANASEYTQDVLIAAGASGLTEAIQSTFFLTHHSFKSYEEALTYVDRLAYGSIVSIKLSGILEETEYEPRETSDANVSTTAEGLGAAPIDAPEAVGYANNLTEKERLLRVISWLLQAVEETDFSPELISLREANGGALAKTQQQLYTTERAVAYTFYGDYGNTAELHSVLESLEEIGGAGTFFVTAEDISQHKDTITSLTRRGHSVGISFSPTASQDYYAICSQLLATRDLLKKEVGYSAHLVMQTSTSATDALREAVSSLDMLLVGADLTFTRESVQSAQTAQAVIEGVYGENTDGFQRGKILRYRIGYMERESLLGELILALEGTRNIYTVTDVYSMATNEAYLYTYPLAVSDILPEVYNRIHSGQLTATGEDFIVYASEHYIGNPDVSDSLRLPGFTRQEIYRLDTRGRMPDAYGTAFLTFDDWGTDVHVTKLLDVLRKHNVKATFFVRTEYVPNNPNLLRAIAMEGHEIASHTHTHLPLANVAEDAWVFEELDEEQVAALREDIQLSWDVLQSIVGDVQLENGKPALTTVFRPPTLAVGRNGMETIFDMGMTYIISGEFTSQDYKAESVKALQRSLRANIWHGSVVVMHFSDNSIYTADALDEYLTMNTAGENHMILKYARISDYLPEERLLEMGLE